MCKKHHPFKEKRHFSGGKAPRNPLHLAIKGLQHLELGLLLNQLPVFFPQCLHLPLQEEVPVLKQAELGQGPLCAQGWGLLWSQLAATLLLSSMW